MGDGARLAIAILILFLAMVAFFFAFHPGGVDNGDIKNFPELLQWMFGEFDTASGSPSATPAGQPGANPVGANVAPIANIPGTNVGPTVNG